MELDLRPLFKHLDGAGTSGPSSLEPTRIGTADDRYVHIQFPTWALADMLCGEKYGPNVLHVLEPRKANCPDCIADLWQKNRNYAERLWPVALHDRPRRTGWQRFTAWLKGEV